VSCGEPLVSPPASIGTSCTRRVRDSWIYLFLFDLNGDFIGIFCWIPLVFFCYFTEVSPFPHRMLGDDVDGPHSSAIIIGRKTVLACAHSLGLVMDKKRGGKPRYKYIEDYWIQPSFTKDSGEFTTDNRVPLKLFKFHASNDWALLVRADEKCFAPEEVASIDRSLLNKVAFNLQFSDAVVMSCGTDVWDTQGRRIHYTM
jgi:hypothetical protein